MEENRLSGGRGAKCVLLSLAVSVGVSLVLLLIFALGLCSAPDPASLAFYFGVGALYAGAAAGGVFCSRRLGAGILSGVLSGGAFCAAVLIVRLIVGGGTLPAVLEELEEIVSGTQSPEDALVRQELLEAIGGFLATLPVRKRQLFVMRYFETASVSELARRFGMRENAVSMALGRLRKQLKAHLLERGFDL